MRKFTLLFGLLLSVFAANSQSCSDLFFSEYIEGSSNNKALELYNPTSSAINLSSYEVRAYNNGNTTVSNSLSFPSSATIPAYGTYVIANSSAVSTITGVADTTSTVTFFNGNDAVVLMNGTDTLDIIGVVGANPGSSGWTVGSGSTSNTTLVRKAIVSEGTTDWTVGATEWDVYASNTDSDLGMHTSNCATGAAPVFSNVEAINTFNSLDANGELDSLGAMKWVKVLVTSIDFDGNAGYSFFVEDATDGINIFNFSDKSGYTTPMMGDSLYAYGEVDQFRGLAQLKVDSIYLVNQNNALPAASVETTLDETTEAELIQLVGFELVDATQWPSSGSANVDITNGTDTFNMRIDSDTDIDGTPAPIGMFDVTGLGSQFDSSSPYDEGYQILPRQLTDIVVQPIVSTGCSDLFISEYIEGGSSNKAIEIYNPTSTAINLSTYELRLFSNGNTTYTNFLSFPTSATIPAYGTYVVANGSANTSISAAADTTSTVTFFNGNDAVVLMNGTDTLDIIGVVGVDPGSSGWTVGTGSTKDYTLVRKATVSEGTTDWTVGATEWDVYAKDTDSDLGMHTSNCLVTVPTPVFSDVVAINTFNSLDANGEVDSLGAMKWVKVLVTSIDFDGNNGYSFFAEDATDGINIFNFSDKSGYTMPMMGDSLFAHGEVDQYRGLTQLKVDSIYLVNQNNTLPTASVETMLDETTESELIQLVGFELVDATQWPAAGSSANVDITNGTDTLTMRIDSDTDIDGTPAPTNTFDVTGLGSQFDFSAPFDEGYQIFPRQLTDIFVYPVIPVYNIADVTGVDADGIADSLNVLCKLVGTVMGVDMQGSATAIQFTIHDGTDGIGVFSSVPAAQSYTVMEGDQVRLIGEIGQFNGLTQMYPDSIVFISANNTLPTPTVVTQLGENTESELVTFTSATLVDPSQWTGSGSGFNVDITNGTDTIAMRIDNDVDLYSQPAPTGAFDVTGIGGQYDFSAPHSSGYQLLPRYQADIVPAAAVYVPQIVVSEIMAGSNAASYDADWFEIYNYGDTVVDLTGMSWDDESGIAGTSVFPSVSIAAGERIIVWDDVAANEDSLLVSWKLYPGSVQVISTDELTGSFPSLSQNGDGVYLYDAAGIELTNSIYASATAGFAVEFDTTGMPLGDAVDGVNGAYTSLNGDVGSPGNLTPNTGAGEFTLNGRIYPNPNTGSFSIEMERADHYTVEIMNILGAVVSATSVEGNTITVDMNVSAGTYLVRVSSARGTVAQRIQVR